MTIKITPETQVRRDGQGVVRQLSHAQQLYKPSAVAVGVRGFSAGTITPRSLAEQYLRDAAGVFQFAPTMVANFAARTGASPTTAGVELRYREEKSVDNAITVSYDQTALGLPIWNAGVTVRINGLEMGVTGSHNAAHYSVKAQPPAPTAAYLPYSLDKDKVARVLNLETGVENLTINATRALVYQYQSKERFDPQITAHEQPNESTGLAGTKAREFPTLSLPTVPHNIVEGQHYVVTEVMFTLPREGWGPVNWRTFVEPSSGVVLYLRALISCARGAVFPSDPVSLTGVRHSAATATSILDPIRSVGPLLGLAPASGSGVQQLRGQFVRLVNVEAPSLPIPAEPSPHDFIYTCNTSNFAACSAYHHCEGFFRLIEGMGIDVASYFNNTDFPISVDPHAINNEVNAACNGNTQGNGIGPVVFGVARTGTNFGIAADVRVVIHEFGHGVLWDHVDSPNFGFAHSPGDSLAVILHDPVSRAPDRFETFPFMKESAGLTRRHDRRVEDGWAWGGEEDDTQYGSEQILSTTLFRVYRAAGGDSPNSVERAFASRYVSYLILKGVSLLQFTTPDPDVFVSALTEADATTGVFEGHPGGAFSKIFRWSFEKQGLYQAPGSPLPIHSPGLPPEVDVYIDDGRGGEYTFAEDFAGNAEIWNRHAADGQTQHQAPLIGVANFAYVRVRNRGTASATETTVRGFQSRNQGASTWPLDWKPLAPVQLAAPADVPSGGSETVGPFSWIPLFEGETLLFGVSALGDRSNLETVTAGPIPNARLVRLDNNTAQRTFPSQS